MDMDMEEDWEEDWEGGHGERHRQGLLKWREGKEIESDVK